MPQPPDRRHQPRLSDNARGVMVGPGFELTCLIVDRSMNGCRIRLERAFSLPAVATLVDVEAGAAAEVRVAWSKGVEAGLAVGQSASLRGLVPSRLLSARLAWVRAGGR